MWGEWPGGLGRGTQPKAHRHAASPNLNEISVLNKAVCLVGSGAAEQPFLARPLCAHSLPCRPPEVRGVRLPRVRADTPRHTASPHLGVSVPAGAAAGARVASSPVREGRQS